MPVGEAIREQETAGFLAGIPYRLAVAFPSWAGAIAAFYAVYLFGSAILRIRQR